MYWSKITAAAADMMVALAVVFLFAQEEVGGYWKSAWSLLLSYGKTISRLVALVIINRKLGTKWLNHSMWMTGWACPTVWSEPYRTIWVCKWTWYQISHHHHRWYFSNSFSTRLEPTIKANNSEILFSAGSPSGTQEGEGNRKTIPCQVPTRGNGISV